MSVSTARKAWQQWKKNHPEFAKNRNFKADLGPQLDALEKAGAAWRQSASQADKALKEYGKAFKNVKTVVEAYGAIVKSIGDPKLKASFDNEFAVFLIKDLDGDKKNIQNDVKIILDDVKNLPPSNHFT